MAEKAPTEVPVETPVVEEVEMAAGEDVKKETEEVVMEDAKEAKEEKKEAEPVKDPEADEVENNDERYSGDEMKLNGHDGTLNCLIHDKGILSSMTVDSLNLLASCRMNAGVSSGRYLFETEILQYGGPHYCEVRLGFSLSDSSLFIGDKGSMGFASNGHFFVDGAAASECNTRRLAKGDIVGLLINRTTEGNANTVSVFINGQRQSSPVKIPDTFDGALFPHVQVTRGAIVAVNLTKEVRSKLPFTCRTIADGSQDDITETNATEVTEAEIIVPLGFHSTEWVESYCAENAGSNFVHITQEYLEQWQLRSGLKYQSLHEGILLAFYKLMCLRKRKFIFSLGHNLLSEDRKKFCDRFSRTSINKIAVLPKKVIENLPPSTAFYKDVTMPTKEEGWNKVIFEESAEEAQKDLKKWQKWCKNMTLVEDFKPSDKLKEKMTEWDKFLAATKKEVLKLKKEKELAQKLANGEITEEEHKKQQEEEAKKEEEEKKKEEERKEEEKKKKMNKAKEEKVDGEDKKEDKKEEEEEEEEVDPSTVNTIDFTEEDWMLARLRMELHTICHAFVEDVEDKERTSFSADFAPHYYKQYAHEGYYFVPGTFGCKNMDEICALIKDTLKVESSMMTSVLPVDTSFDDFVQLTEDARQERVDRIGAGDEGAQLKFKAQTQRFGVKGSKGMQYKGGNYPQYYAKGPKGGKGSMPMTPQRTTYANGWPAPTPKGNYGGKGDGYAMRSLPGMKRLEPSMLTQSAAKRFR